MATELRISLENVSKRFGREWVIRDRNETYRSGNCYGIRGRNGSGKSTLLRLLAGQLAPSRGRLAYRLGQRDTPAAEIYSQVAWAGPYLEIVEELTVREMLEFHFSMKPLVAGLSVNALLDRIELSAAADRKLTDCSSGMRQRVLLATALYADTALLLLDEPTVTLDDGAANWFAEELEGVRDNRLVIIASNDARDLVACSAIRNL